ncbi:MAG: prepilin-type N-terminal cleavage/methylation domain-containing protein [Victivallaceae bacterium]
MSNRKKIKRLRFTLVELIMAMAVFSILSLIMMRFYSSAQQVWSKASQRADMYNDAHIALDLMARELQAVMYNNDNSTAGIYPFWFQKIRDVSSPAVGTDPVNNYYPHSAGSDFELTQLNFIADTDLKPKGAVSNTCEVRYRFVPAGETIPLAQSIDGKDIGEGWLVRSCTPDMTDNGTGVYIPNTKWDFTTPLPRLKADGTAGSATRINDIWGDVTTGKDSSSLYQRVISGVYFLKFTCYYIDAGGNWQESYPIRYTVGGTPLFSFGSGAASNVNGGATGTAADTLATAGLNGTPLPDAVKIDLFMLSPTDWREWKAKIDMGNIPAAEVIKLQRMRTFSKVVFINNRLNF